MYFSVEHIRDQEAQAKAAGADLMHRAGLASADFVDGHFGRAKPILCMVGPGNNGGDALTCAALLAARGHQVTVVMPDQDHPPPPEALQAREKWCGGGRVVCGSIPTADYVAVVDGLFGIGLNRALDGRWQRELDQVNGLGRPVLALDVPSGVHADTGALLARPIVARWTTSFIARPRGLATGAALDYVGDHLLNALGQTMSATAVARCSDMRSVVTLRRRQDSHKGSFGSVRVVGGSDGLVGAALLAGRAALRTGAGKVTVGLLAQNRPGFDAMQPELMLCNAGRCASDDVGVIVAGPGLGRSEASAALLRQMLRSAHPMLLDADALNLVALDGVLAERIRERTAPTVVTPHPSEAARLLGATTEDVQRDRYAAAYQLAVGLRAVVVLKGAGSIICDGERQAVNDSGSAALSNAGQGDVLSGIIGGLLAQGFDAWVAANLGCHIHGAASDMLALSGRRHLTLATDVIDHIADVMDF